LIKEPRKNIHTEGAVCAKCLKPARLCVCDALQPVATKTQLLILQHPQEPDVLLGSARLTHLCLPNSKLVVGLSWPNLKKALGTDANPKQWLVLYLGSAKVNAPKERYLMCVDRKGKQQDDSAARLKGIRGIIVLDGTWSQAKTLWWRNAWLNKLQRAVLLPPRPSLYGKLRREPRRESLSTLESVAICLSELEKDPKLQEKLLAPFRLLLKKASTT